MDYITELAEEIRARLDPGTLPDEPVDELLRSYAVLALVLGKDVTPEDVHDAWVAWMAARQPDHPSLVPFDGLAAENAEQDLPFVEAIRATAHARQIGRHALGTNMTESVKRILTPSGPPSSEEARQQFFELYKIMVASSEALVGRRQAVNTFFLTMNGLLLTAVGLFLRGGSYGHLRLQAAAVLVLAAAGATLCIAWRSLIISFGQLNTGKFAIINEMESELAAAIFAAEWEALQRGSNPKVYRTFTSREIFVPLSFGALYVIAASLSAAVALGWWHPKL